MPLTKDRARRAASELLDSFWDGRFPVDPARIAMQLGVQVYQGNLGETSGMLVKETGMPAEIYLNDDEILERQNFTCAHELGHFIERRERGDDEYSFVDKRGSWWDPGDAREWFAEHFAANLLMPDSEFYGLADRGYSVSRLASFFGVSKAAVRTRARGLGVSVWE